MRHDNFVLKESDSLKGDSEGKEMCTGGFIAIKAWQRRQGDEHSKETGRHQWVYDDYTEKKCGCVLSNAEVEHYVQSQ